MRLLLDTHALLWWWSGDRRMPRKIRSLFTDDGSEIYVSSISVLEIAIKFRVGKLPEAGRIIERFEEILVEQGFRELSVTSTHARRAGLLTGKHRDPFDRILAAQSLIEDLVVVSKDDALGKFGARTMW